MARIKYSKGNAYSTPVVNNHIEWVVQRLRYFKHQVGEEYRKGHWTKVRALINKHVKTVCRYGYSISPSAFLGTQINKHTRARGWQKTATKITKHPERISYQEFQTVLSECIQSELAFKPDDPLAASTRADK